MSRCYGVGVSRMMRFWMESGAMVAVAEPAKPGAVAEIVYGPARRKRRRRPGVARPSPVSRATTP